MLAKVDEIKKSLAQVKFSIDDLFKISRLSEVTQQPFKVIDKDKIEAIATGLAEVNNKVYCFSRSTSQVSRKLQTLVFMFPAPATYRILHQLFAQIEKKQQAILENIARLEEAFVEIKELSSEVEQETDDLLRAKKEAQLKKKVVSLAQSFSYIEAALKELGFLLESYEQIKRNKNIPDNWDELDFEEQEIRAHIMGAFRLAVRDMLSHNSINVSTYEWFEQLGISPFEALKEVSDYFQRVFSNDGRVEDYDGFMDWLEAMADKYADSYKKACKRIGLDVDDFISKRYTLMLKDSNDEENNN